jgi:hypothetical protein
MPETPAAAVSPLLIDLVEPDEPALAGDAVPCHLFMPEVSWPVPVGPVIRVRPRREHWLVEPPARPEPSTDLLEPAGVGFVAALSAATWCLGVVALSLVFLKGWS